MFASNPNALAPSFLCLKNKGFAWNLSRICCDTRIYALTGRKSERKTSDVEHDFINKKKKAITRLRQVLMRLNQVLSF